jgi:hypothetical protein
MIVSLNVIIGVEVRSGKSEYNRQVSCANQPALRVSSRAGLSFG